MTFNDALTRYLLECDDRDIQPGEISEQLSTCRPGPCWVMVDDRRTVLAFVSEDRCLCGADLNSDYDPEWQLNTPASRQEAIERGRGPLGDYLSKWIRR